jgi:hypothetical protein
MTKQVLPVEVEPAEFNASEPYFGSPAPVPDEEVEQMP